MGSREPTLDLAALLGLEARCASGLVRRGRWYLTRGRTREANDLLVVATMLSPRNLEAWRARAEVERRAGRPDRAEGIDRMVRSLEAA